MQTNKIILFFFFFCFSTIIFSSCLGNDDCDKVGTLEFRNTSTITVQRLIVGDIDHGLVNPGESVSLSLNSGLYTMSAEGESGGAGCGALGDIFITNCSIIIKTCEN